MWMWYNFSLFEQGECDKLQAKSSERSQVTEGAHTAHTHPHKPEIQKIVPDSILRK